MLKKMLIPFLTLLVVTSIELNSGCTSHSKYSGHDTVEYCSLSDPYAPEIEETGGTETFSLAGTPLLSFICSSADSYDRCEASVAACGLGVAECAIDELGCLTDTEGCTIQVDNQPAEPLDDCSSTPALSIDESDPTKLKLEKCDDVCPGSTVDPYQDSDLVLLSADQYYTEDASFWNPDGVVAFCERIDTDPDVPDNVGKFCCDFIDPTLRPSWDNSFATGACADDLGTATSIAQTNRAPTPSGRLNFRVPAMGSGFRLMSLIISALLTPGGPIHTYVEHHFPEGHSIRTMVDELPSSTMEYLHRLDRALRKIRILGLANRQPVAAGRPQPMGVSTTPYVGVRQPRPRTTVTGVPAPNAPPYGPVTPRPRNGGVIVRPNRTR